MVADSCGGSEFRRPETGVGEDTWRNIVALQRFTNPTQLPPWRPTRLAEINRFQRQRRASRNRNDDADLWRHPDMTRSGRHRQSWDE